MATLANVNNPVVNPAAAPTTNNLTAGPDQFAATYGRQYTLRFNNPTGAAFTVKLDDPTFVSPVGTTLDPDVLVPVAAGQARAVTVDANRFRNSSGFISWTYSVGTGAGSTVEIHGPY